MDAFNYGTRSSTILEIGGVCRGWHVDEPPCEAPYGDISELVNSVAGAGG
jgi:hypothetical protein